MKMLNVEPVELSGSYSLYVILKDIRIRQSVGDKDTQFQNINIKMVKKIGTYVKLIQIIKLLYQ